MAKRGRRKAVKEPVPKPKTTDPPTTSSNCALRFEEQQRAFNDREVERRITAIQAIRDAEIENLLSRLRLLCSYFSTEQLQIPSLQFFNENLPNLSVLKNEKYGVFELEWKEKDEAPINHVDGKTMRTSLDTAATLSATRGLQFSTRSVKTSFLDAACLRFPDFDLGAPSETQLLGQRDVFQTPGETSHRLSVGMTPKTLRLPKHGEMLLSIRGSPLGVYREESLEAIHESEDGSHGGASK